MVKWFRIYCWVLCVLYLLVALASVPFFVVDPEVKAYFGAS